MTGQQNLVSKSFQDFSGRDGDVRIVPGVEAVIEEHNLLRTSLRRSPVAEPGGERFGGEFGQGTLLADAKGALHKLSHDRVTHGAIDQRRQGARPKTRQGADMAKETGAQGRSMFTMVLRQKLDLDFAHVD